VYYHNSLGGGPNVDKRVEEMKASYDRLAVEYAERFFNELEKKPKDRELLDRFATSVRNSGPVCDLGT
jgi:hypothetical protein